MARILLAWELGHGLGHVTALRALSDCLSERGHEVIVAGRDLISVRTAFEGSKVGVLAAPFFPGVFLPPQQMCSLADVLWFESAGHSIETFRGLFMSWRHMFDFIKPDLLVSDAAQVAVAAAASHVPSINYVHGFHSTDAQAWAVFRDWEQIDRSAPERRAEQLLAHLNIVRGEVGLDAVDSLHAGFGADRHLFRCLPEMDHVGERTGVRYIGQILSRQGVASSWPGSSDAHRIFMYLRRDYEHVDRLLGALQRLDNASVLCFHNGISEHRLPKAAHIAYSTELIDLTSVLPESTLVICHGGGLHATATQFGKPSVVLPLHTEQFLSARAAEVSGISCLQSPFDGKRPNLLAMLREALADDVMADRARAAGVAQGQREPDPAAALVDEVEGLVTRG